MREFGPVLGLSPPIMEQNSWPDKVVMLVDKSFGDK